MSPAQNIFNEEIPPDRHDLRDVTFIIPIFLDTPERARNFQNNIAFLESLFQT